MTTGSSGPVDIASVVDRHDGDPVAFIVDGVNHSKVTAPCGVVAFEVESKRSAYSMWVPGEASVNELDTRRRDLLG